ncbi:MAG TPA: hypothetical protein VFF26_05970 [Gallionella sp.]|nr:hypothetical protein [Gallionella sp.]
MIIRKDTAIFPVRETYASTTPRQAEQQAPSSNAATIADITTISDEARARLSADNSSPYQIKGQAYSLKDAMEKQGIPLIAVEWTDAQLKEVQLREQQEEARRAANSQFAQAHQYQPVGQVFVGGNLFATVYDSGSYMMSKQLPGLSSSELSPSARLAEIAKAVKGEIRTTNLVPTEGWAGPKAPESQLPPITARSMQEIFEQELRPVFDAKIKAWEAETGRQYPVATAWK